MPDYIDIVVQETPVYVDVIKSGGVYLDIVYSAGRAVDSVNGQTGTVLINAVPDGGTTGQVLAKASDGNNDTEWINQQSLVWGGITGTLSSQTDLQSALDAKQNSLGFTPENVSNKKGTINNSSTEYPTSAAVLTGLTDVRNPRVSTLTTTTSLTPNLDLYDCISVTDLASTLIISWTGSPVDFQPLIIRIKDNGTARALTWEGAKFEAKGTVLPTTTVTGKVLTVAFLYDSVTGKFGCVGAQQEA